MSADDAKQITRKKAPSRMPQVSPLNAIGEDDVPQGAGLVNQWLKRVSGVGLQEVQAVVAGGAVQGNSMALVDSVADLMYLTGESAEENDWTRFAINLLGLYQGAEGGVRISLRVVLHFLRDRLIAGGTELKEADVSALIAHINTTHPGEIDTYADALPGVLPGFLSEAGRLGAQLAAELAGAVETAKPGAEGGGHGGMPLHYYEEETIPAVWTEMWKLSLGVVKEGTQAETATPPAPETGRSMSTPFAGKLRTLAGEIPGKVAAQIGVLMPFISALQAAAKKWRGNLDKDGVSANIPLGGGGEIECKRQEGALGALSVLKENTEACNDCKNCPATGRTTCSIGFALGDETIVQSDFALSGVAPFIWRRVYNSRLAAYDESPLGARWTNEWLVSIDETTRHLIYHSPDGRSQRCPKPGLGQIYRNGIEGYQLAFFADGRKLILSRGKDEQGIGEHAPFLQVFEQTAAKSKAKSKGQKTRYRLMSEHHKGGLGIALRYDHCTPDAREILSDVVMSLNGKALHHLHTVVDAHGHIESIWQMAKGKPVRQLARYFYLPDASRAGEAEVSGQKGMLYPVGDLLTAQDEHGHHRIYQYRNHLVTRYTDRTERGMNIEWDGEEATARAIREYADDGSFDTRLEWDKIRRRTIVTDAQGDQTIHHLDPQGYTIRMTHPDGKDEWFYRDAGKNVIRHQHPEGNSENYRWSRDDELLSHTGTDGSTTWYEYDSESNLIGIQDPEGGVWRREYDGKGNLTAETDPLGNKTEYKYDKDNQPIEITDAKGGKKQLSYTESGQIKSYADCSGKTISWEYDERSRVKSITSAVGGKTQYRYGDFPILNQTVEDVEAEGQRLRQERQNVGQLESITYPDQSKETFHHDAEGRLLIHTDPTGRETQWQYTGAGLLRGRKDTAGQILKYDWDRRGRLTALTNENNATTKFSYDPVGRLLEQTGWDDKATRYHYDQSAGRLTRIEQAGGVQKQLDFDAAGRVIRQQSGKRTPDGTWQKDAETRYQWDRNGHLLLAENEQVRLQWFHDSAGNLMAEQQHYRNSGMSAIWRHQYDPLGNRIATIRPDGHRVEHLTYGSGHVHGIQLDGEALSDMERDDLHREVERTLKNGLIQTRNFDAMGRLKEQILLKQPITTNNPLTDAMTPLLKRSYAYDRTGQLNRIQDMNGSRNYRYDPVGRLIEAVTPQGKETFAFDPAGNLLDTAKPPMGKLTDNLVRDYQDVRYRYDPSGNLTEKIDPEGMMTRYQWNSLNQLIEVNTGSVITRFAYDPLGRRIAKHSQPIVSRNSNDGSQYHKLEAERISREQNLGTTLYGWEGDRLAWESRHDKSIHYFYEPNSFIPLAQGIQSRPIKMHKTPDWTNRIYKVKEDPLWTQTPEPEPFRQLLFYHCDQIGTPMLMTDERGEIVWQADYKAWGEARITAKEGIRNPIRFQGQYFDHETGLHYNRHRYYDPEIGRFISKDPIGLNGGLNLYSYAPNPVEWVDPLGLFDVYGKKIKTSPDSHEYKFTVRFGATNQASELLRSGMVELVKTGNKVVDFLVTRNVKNIKLGAGLENDMSLSNRLTCVKHENSLNEIFEKHRYKSGMLTGTYLTEKELSEYLSEAKKALPDDVKKLYDFDTLIQRAKERTLPAPGDLL